MGMQIMDVLSLGMFAVDENNNQFNHHNIFIGDIYGNLWCMLLMMTVVLFFQAAAYYFHGLILDEGYEDNAHALSLASVKAAENYLKESQKARTSFGSMEPLTKWVLFSIRNALFMHDVL